MKNVDIRTIRNAYQHILMIIICIFLMTLCGILLLVCFPGGSVVKNLLANAGDTGLIPGWGRSLKKETATHSSILAWEIPWAEEAGRLQSMWLQRVGHNLVTEHDDIMWSISSCTHVLSVYLLW